MTGFVSFVSAGPGDPELLTLRGIKRLQAADVILHDNLAQHAATAFAKPGAIILPVGKRARGASTPQTRINALLVDHALKHPKVVRLKSGDAGIFGRLEEEIAALDAHDIPFEIVPGVSAASAAAAAAGIPLTRRDIARRVQFVTGHDSAGGLSSGVDIAALADPNAISAVYMARATFAKLARAMISAGLPPTTPACLAESVSTEREALSFSTVGELGARLAGSQETLAGQTLILFGPLTPPPRNRSSDADR